MGKSDRRSLSERLRFRDPVLGLIVKMPSAALIETAGYVGFDLVVIDAEHGNGDGDDLEAHLRAADAVGVDSLVRVGTNDPLSILRALDAGATGVIVPHVNTLEDAKRAAAAAHYPPAGTRGLAMSTRAGRYATGTLHEHIARADRETVVIVQIEDKRAVPHARDIAEAPHVDAIWVGPGDLSMSLGHPGDLAHPEVRQAIGTVTDAVLSVDGSALCVVCDDEYEMKEWFSQGASVGLFVSTNLIARRLKSLLSTLRDERATTMKGNA